jgi:NAD(P)H-quinone oxidoreductase subunit 5
MTIAELPLFIPVSFFFTFLAIRFGGVKNVQTAASLGIGVSAVNILVSLAVGAAVLKLGALDEGSLFGLHADPLSAVLLLLLTSLALVIQKYSHRYMGGEERQTYFIAGLLFILTFISFFVLARNLLTMFVAWQFVSYGLHALLVYFDSRPAALEAARKKLVISRVGDLFLVASLWLAYDLFGTLDLPEIFAEVSKGTGHPFDPFVLFGWPTGLTSLDVWGLLLAIGAMTKSAQVPFHFWLPETMEAPTPVSALMHAGIINAGGILLTRLSPILIHSPSGLHVLFIVGTLTAFFGAFVMLVQSDVKRSLAYSTIAQMGFMMVQVGLGAFTAAIFHLCTHAVYKAYAFLSAGGDVARETLPGTGNTGGALVPAAFAVAGAFLSVFAAEWLSGLNLETKSGGLVLVAFYGATVAQILFTVARSQYVSFGSLGGALGLVTVALTAYFLVLHSLELFFLPILPEPAFYHAFDGLAGPLVGITLVAFALTWLSSWGVFGSFFRSVRSALYVAALRKFYLGDAFSSRDRLW